MLTTPTQILYGECSRAADPSGVLTLPEHILESRLQADLYVRLPGYWMGTNKWMARARSGSEWPWRGQRVASQTLLAQRVRKHTDYLLSALQTDPESGEPCEIINSGNYSADLLLPFASRSLLNLHHLAAIEHLSGHEGTWLFNKEMYSLLYVYLPTNYLLGWLRVDSD